MNKKRILRKDLPTIASRIHDLEELARTLDVPQKKINTEYTFAYKEFQLEYQGRDRQFYHEKAIERVKAVYHPMVGRHDVS